MSNYGRQSHHIFFHPDFTVGIGISPIQFQGNARTVTAGQELHLALKI
jgi:hypothetical protein